jgi:hypothetical protein
MLAITLSLCPSLPSMCNTKCYVHSWPQFNSVSFDIRIFW